MQVRASPPSTKKKKKRKKKGIFIPRVHLDPAGATNQYLTVASIRNATAPFSQEGISSTVNT
jgi:hypothetical protein